MLELHYIKPSIVGHLNNAQTSSLSQNISYRSGVSFNIPSSNSIQKYQLIPILHSLMAGDFEFSDHWEQDSCCSSVVDEPGRSNMDVQVVIVLDMGSCLDMLEARSHASRGFGLAGGYAMTPYLSRDLGFLVRNLGTRFVDSRIMSRGMMQWSCSCSTLAGTCCSH